MSSNGDASKERYRNADFSLQNRLIAVLHLMPVLKNRDAQMPTPPTHTFTFTRKQSASNKTPRQINRNLVFNLIRTRQPISRADLARVSGLQRSTVSLIVEDLINERWILEGSTGRPPRGRRPTFLELNQQRAVIALDIHPSQT